MTAARIPASDISQVVDVLTDAFADYPVMRFVLGPDGNTRERLSRLIGLFVFRRSRLGGPMFGLRAGDGRLIGAAVMTLPAEPEPPADVLQLRDEVWQTLGHDCLERHDAYSAVAKTLSVPEPHHHLNMIGVRHADHGRGFARPLLEAAIDLAAGDPQSAGLSLTTETVANVRLYEHFGFEVVGRGRVANDFDTWGLFKTTRN
jgi:ribosomal protein S18 acetylase RimI-like enzyme